MSDIIKNVVIGICLFLFLGIAIDTFTRPRVNKDAPTPKYNVNFPLEANPSFGDRWRLSAMQQDSDPKEMKLYLTKDLQMIWMSNDIAGKYGGIKNPSITTRQEYLNYYLRLISSYIEIISYANVDFPNVKTKQKKNLLLIVQEVFFHKTRWLLGKNYAEIMSENLPKDKIRNFGIDDIQVLKKGNNLCITFNGETINPYYELDVIDQNLDSYGISSRAIKNFLSTNKPK
jgi:hypothetical protein